MPSGLSILTASRPICGKARSFTGIEARSGDSLGRLPAALESRRQALVGGTQRGFADRGRDADAVEQFLLGADLAKPFVVAGRQRLAGAEAGAGVGDAELRRLLGLIISQRARGDPGQRQRRQVYAVCAGQTAMALLGEIVAVLQ